MAFIPRSDFGQRNAHNDRYRWLTYGVLLLAVVLLETTLGTRLERSRITQIEQQADNWAIARYTSGTTTIPPKSPGVQRIAYLSNSHAKTGGWVAKHLQDLLNRIAPGQFEVLDIAEPGIFAPDMLQRGLAAQDYDLDLVILGVSYISFSDRMKLSLQAHSARSFFDKGIVSRLPAGFWWRNYDIGLFTDTWFSRQFKLYRNRNRVRDYWEEPMATAIQQLTGRPGPVLFLQVDVKKGWRFPEGYDNNLFQWNLYAAGRAGHVADLKALITALTDAGTPILGFNTPIDFGKTVFPYDAEDYQRYRHTMVDLFRNAATYTDYQDFFPKDFSTYDALHPTWQGARLHALDLVIRMALQGMFANPPSAQVILEQFLASDSTPGEEYRLALSDPIQPPQRSQFRRYELGEPKNARNLLQKLVGLKPGSRQEQLHLISLSRRIRYWLETEFNATSDGAQNGAYAEIWQKAVTAEIQSSRRRIAHFRDRLTAIQQQRLLAFPIPSLQGARQTGRETVEIGNGQSLQIATYKLQDNLQVNVMYTPTGSALAYRVQGRKDRSAYQRIDILGDGSFLLIQPLDEALKLPDWIFNKTVGKRWGV